MGAKRRKHDLRHGLGREDLPPAGVEVLVYRRCQDDREKWEYLGTLEPETNIDLDDLGTKTPEELYFLSPHHLTQQRWGGGEYQFRFFWRNEEGRREQKRSSNGEIEGHPLPK